MRNTAYIVLALPLALLCACDRNAPSTAAPASKQTTAHIAAVYKDSHNGFAIDVPADMSLRHDFQRSYLGNASWKAYASTDGRGTPAVALVLNGSNAVTAAELRIGIGTDALALEQCTAVAASGAAAADTVVLAGVPSTHFHAADAAMSHYLDVDAYRVVHAGRCYAIDLLLTGTRPEVYDPPATPPFARTHAQQRLRLALNGFRFLPQERGR